MPKFTETEMLCRIAQDRGLGAGAADAAEANLAATADYAHVAPGTAVGDGVSRLTHA